MIIALSSLKGGSGKTTIAVHLAHGIARNDRKVLLVDADPQGSASTWATVREDKSPFPVIGMARNTLHRDLETIASDYEHIIIDTPPRVSALSRSAILASDLVLIPVQPSSYDIWAASETVDLVQEAQGFKPDLKAAFVINRKIANSAIGKEAKKALEDYPIPILKATIAQRVAFAESSAGYTVFESGNTTAIGEIVALVDDIQKFMGTKQW